MGTAICNRIVAFARVVGAINHNATDFLVLRDLVEKVGWDGRITDVAPGDFDGPDLQRFFIDPRRSLRQTRRFGGLMPEGQDPTLSPFGHLYSP